jgi:hypothetical protein
MDVGRGWGDEGNGSRERTILRAKALGYPALAEPRTDVSAEASSFAEAMEDWLAEAEN